MHWSRRSRPASLPSKAKYDVLHELAAKQEQFQQAIVQALGVSLEATVAPKREPGARESLRRHWPTETFAYRGAGAAVRGASAHDNPGASRAGAEPRVAARGPGGRSPGRSRRNQPVPASVAAGQALDQRFNVQRAARCRADAALFHAAERRAALSTTCRRTLPQSFVRSVSADGVGRDSRYEGRAGAHRASGADGAAADRRRAWCSIR